MNFTPEERLEQVISDIGLGLFPADVQDEVESLLASGQALEPAARARFVAAAKRGSRHVAVTHAALEVLLFNERHERRQEAEEIAGFVNIDADTIRAIERGERAIDSEDPGRIGAWAWKFGLGREIIEEGLKRSLGTGVRTASYAGERKVLLSLEQEAFVDSVLRAFDEQEDTAATE